MRFRFILVFLLAGLCFTAAPGSLAATPQPTATLKACHICDEVVIPAATTRPVSVKPAVVHVVMFWMDTCSHCHSVLEEVLPPLQQKYGEQLEVLLIEIKNERDWNRLVQVGAAFDIPQDRLGVPFMVVGGAVLIGSAQIPAELPGLIEQHLATGGIDYPAVPGLIDLLPTPAAPTGTSNSTSTPIAPIEATATPAPIAKLVTDQPVAPPVAVSVASSTPNGFGLAIGIMVGMAAALAYVGVVAVRSYNHTPARPVPVWLEETIPPLAVLGLGVAVYLAYVETQAVAAVCGPVGDCNAVQASPYAKLFGVLPVGVLGALGYVAILAAWLWGRFGSGRLADYAPLAVFGMTLFGTLYSLYLTYLEPFVIGAVCIWCLSSAIIITLLMLFSLKPALQVVRQTATTG